MHTTTSMIWYAGKAGSKGSGKSRSGGGSVASVRSGAASICAWEWEAEKSALACSAPERVSALAIDPTGEYAWMGGWSGKIYAWHIASGRLGKRPFPPLIRSCVPCRQELGFFNGRSHLLSSTFPSHSDVVFDAHYKRVAVIAVTNDGLTLVTAGYDCVVSVWSVVDIMTPSVEKDRAPIRSWADHSMPVTGMPVALAFAE